MQLRNNVHSISVAPNGRLASMPRLTVREIAAVPFTSRVEEQPSIRHCLCDLHEQQG